MKKEDIAVLIPIYTTSLNPQETISLKQNIKVLKDYTIIFVKPETLDISVGGMSNIYNPALHRTESFDDRYFKSLRGYNKLVLEEEFYSRFAEYGYVLICQTDAYVFRDELLDWCLKGYDYIGAPWPPMRKHRLNFFDRMSYRWRIRRFRQNKNRFHRTQVGNGGLSLRKTDTFIGITSKYKEHFAGLLSDDRKFYPEDLMLLLELEHTEDRLHKPGFDEALRFAFDENPQWVYNYQNGQLPFGCHAWYKPQAHYDFWKRFIKDAD